MFSARRLPTLFDKFSDLVPFENFPDLPLDIENSAGILVRRGVREARQILEKIQKFSNGRA
jgi:hypothetical protein